MRVTMPTRSDVAAPAADYAKLIHFNAPPETAFEALATLPALAAWWGPVTGSGAEGGEWRFMFSTDEPKVLRVDVAERPSRVIWSVRSCSWLPDWVGTTVSFTLRPSETGGCDLDFRHTGLTPQLECYEQCSAGWDYFLPSLRSYVDLGSGSPFRRNPAT